MEKSGGKGAQGGMEGRPSSRYTPESRQGYLFVV